MTVRKNTFKAKSEYVKSNAGSIELIILGSSHNWRAINPKFLNRMVAPLAHGESAINIDHLLFNRFTPAFPKLKAVIFELGYHNLEDYRDSSWNKNHLFNIYYGVNNYGTNPPFHELLLVTANPMQYFKHLIVPKRRQALGTFNRFGFINSTPSSIFKSANYNIDSANKNVMEYLDGKHINESKEFYARNVAHMNEMVNYCHEHNIVVIFLSSPKHSSYNEKMLAGKLERRNAYLDSCSNHENIHILNYEKKYENSSSLFLNPDHLNPDGAELFSKELNRQIENILSSTAQ